MPFMLEGKGDTAKLGRADPFQKGFPFADNFLSFAGAQYTVDDCR